MGKYTAPQIDVVAGAQFGSEGKGMVAGELARGQDDMLSIRVGGPNAGHCVLDETGRKWALRSLPVGTVVNRGPIAIAAGSELDLDVLFDEIEATEAAGFRTKTRLIVDPEATLICSEHGERERNIATGTTGKGIGAARCDRLMRKASRWHDYAGRFTSIRTGKVSDLIRGSKKVLIEGTQGYGLGSHAGYYPFCTSGDCRVQDFLGQAEVPFELYGLVTPYLVARMHPIRIAGNSGPLQNETTWEAIGQPAELTTVTQKVRRVGQWDPELVRNAIDANGGYRVRLVLTFLDYEFPDIHGDAKLEDGPALDFVKTLSMEVETPIMHVGTGPRTLAPIDWR